jgi:phospholipase C
MTMSSDARSALPENLRAVLELPPPPGDPLDAIEHVVILVQENRGFDHYFGTLRGVRGYADRSAMLLPGSRDSVFAQPSGSQPSGSQPSGDRAAPVTPHPADEQELYGQPHNWSDGHEAWNDGRMDGWVPAKGARTMSYFDRSRIPFYYALADAFTICDDYHCSVLGPTSPNRNYLFSGMTGFEPADAARPGMRAVDNDADRPGHPGYDWTSYPERLEAAGVSWRVLHEWDDFGSTNAAFFRPLKEIGRKAAAKTGHANTQFFYDALLAADAADRPEMLARLAEGVAGLSEDERSLYDRALHRVPPDNLEAEFRSLLAAGDLPTVTWFVTKMPDSEHPDSRDAARGMRLTERLLDTLASFPEFFAKTVFLLTYDENDGFFDHVPPPVPTPGTAGEEYVEGQPIGLGMRVPMLVVSPWTRGGYVSSETFDHTSVLRLLERVTGVAEPNISAWRRAVCGDLTSVLRSGERGSVRPAPVVARGFGSEAAASWLPVQEAGVRWALPLPYQPDSFLIAVPGGVELTLRNDGTATAHLTAYDNLAESGAARHYDVAPGASVTDFFAAAAPSAAYDVSCYGPNRFLRRFTGSVPGCELGTAIDPQADGGTLRVFLVNDSEQPATFRLEAVHYQDTEIRTVTVPAGGHAEEAWPVGRGAHGWYDITVGVDADPTWSRRLIGHIETGEDSVSG